MKKTIVLTVAVTCFTSFAALADPAEKTKGTKFSTVCDFGRGKTMVIKGDLVKKEVTIDTEKAKDPYPIGTMLAGDSFEFYGFRCKQREGHRVYSPKEMAPYNGHFCTMTLHGDNSDDTDFELMLTYAGYPDEPARGAFPAVKAHVDIQAVFVEYPDGGLGSSDKPLVISTRKCSPFKFQ